MNPVSITQYVAKIKLNPKARQTQYPLRLLHC